MNENENLWNAWYLAMLGVSLATVLLAWFVHWSVGLAFWVLATALLIAIRPDA